MAKMTTNALMELTAAAEKWVSSPEGQEATKAARKTVEETTEFLSSERVVDGQMLQMPMSL
jgi:hypothetical protein